MYGVAVSRALALRREEEGKKGEKINRHGKFTQNRTRQARGEDDMAWHTQKMNISSSIYHEGEGRERGVSWSGLTRHTQCEGLGFFRLCEMLNVFFLFVRLLFDT